MWGLIWIQTVDTDGIPERIVPKVYFVKKTTAIYVRQKCMKIYPVGKDLNEIACT